MKNFALLPAAIFIAFAAPALAQDTSASSTSSESSAYPSTAEEIQPAPVADRQTFVTKAAIGNMFEVQSSQLALSNGSSDAVKSFAQHMIDDHGKAGEELSAAAAADAATVPTELDQTHTDMLAQLQAATGESFDALYIQMQTQAHIDAVSLFAGYAEGGQAGATKDFAAKTLPTLQQHYEEVLGLSQ